VFSRGAQGAAAAQLAQGKIIYKQKTFGDQTYSLTIKFLTFTLLLFYSFTSTFRIIARWIHDPKTLEKKFDPILDHAAMTQMMKAYALFLALIYAAMGSVQVH
jgi:hypothetical protein